MCLTPFVINGRQIKSATKVHLTPTRMTIRKQMPGNAGEEVGKRNPHSQFVGE